MIKKILLTNRDLKKIKVPKIYFKDQNVNKQDNCNQ
jgi:hypothetical protein